MAPPGGAGGGPGNRQAGKARQEKVTGPGGNFGQSLFVDVVEENGLLKQVCILASVKYC